ncbi:MAG: prepilin-type N-terminal cleavage/methylation domain-containing protein [Verrucomicrobiota bacterium]|nr:prepilin-type N-terminal cleavage/methylation domain-containing protein [Verrucomicrobiota bacterium]
MISDRNLAGRRRLRAFTLVELLVIIALLGVLFSMMTPAMVKAVAKAQEVYCLNNLRNISVGQILYSQDHDNHLTPHAMNQKPPSNAIVPNSKMTMWPDLLETYVGDRRAFRCPCMKCDLERGMGFGMNLGVAGEFMVESVVKAPHASQITNPALAIYFADAAFITPETMRRPMSEWQEDTSRPLGSWTIRTPADRFWNWLPTRVIPRHGARSNVGFVDGHVESRAIRQLGFGYPEGHPQNLWDRH